MLASAGPSAAAAEQCKLGYEIPGELGCAISEADRDGRLRRTVNPVLRGADIKVAAQPGLTAEWLERQLEAQVAAGECQFGIDQVAVDVLPMGDRPASCG